MTGVYLAVGFFVTWAVILIVVGVSLYVAFEYVCGLIRMGRVRYLLRRYHKLPVVEGGVWKLIWSGYRVAAWRFMMDEYGGQVGAIIVPRYPWQKLRRAPMWS